MQGDGTGSALVWFEVLVPVDGNGQSGERDTHRVSAINNRESGAAEGRQEMIYTGLVGSARSGRNSVGNKLHWPKTEDSDTVGGSVADI